MTGEPGTTGSGSPPTVEDDGERFGLWITDLSDDETTWIGSLKFPLQDGAAIMKPHASATIELYGIGPVRPVEIPMWHVSVGRPTGDGVPATPFSPRTDGHIHPGLGHIDPYVENTGGRNGKRQSRTDGQTHFQSPPQTPSRSHGQR